MKKLLAKLVLLTAIVLGICYASFYLNPEFETNYLASIKLKLDKLEKVEKNKVVIIGGSNVCIGVNTDDIENTIEEPVVNMGLHGSLGPKFWLEYVKSNMNEGDVLIMSPEYPLLSKDKWYGMKGTAVPKTILYTPSKLNILLSDYQFFKVTTTGIFRTIKAYWENYPFEQKPFQLKEVYDIRSFDQDNFNSVYLKGNLTKKYGKDKYNFEKDNTSWEELKAYKTYFDEKGVAFYLSPPAVLNESVKRLNAIDYLKAYSEHSGVPILNENFNYFYARNLMFDTNYHLNNKGAAIRTNELKKDLNTAIFNKEISEKQQVLLSQPKFEPVLLDNLKMKHNVKLKRFGNDSIVVNPSRDGRMGFIMYKTEPKNYIGNLLKITVKAKPEVLKSLQFRGIKLYDFDYVKDLGNDTYSLCKSLSNVYTNPKDNSFSSVGIGYDFKTLNKNHQFNILDVQIIDYDLNCEEVSEYNLIDVFNVPKNVKKLIFEIHDFESEEIFLKDILNVSENDVVLENKNKYILLYENKKLSLFDFYKNDVIYEIDNLNKLTFINSSKFNRAIKLLY